MRATTHAGERVVLVGRRTAGYIRAPISARTVTTASTADHDRFTTASPVLNTLRLRTFGGLRIDRPLAAADTGQRPRTLALLAILAAADAPGITRERIMALLWPEADEDRARHALSQALYNLRRDMGGDVVVSTPALRLDPAQIASDVQEFRTAVAAKEWTTAAELYAGPFLDGFHLADAPEFERWVELQRAALATEGIRAIEIVAKSAAEAGHLDKAAEYWRRLTSLDPADPRLAAAYMKALAALGDHAAARAHGRAHAELIRLEYEAEPHDAIARLMYRFSELHVTGPHPVAPQRIPVATQGPAPSAVAPSSNAGREAHAAHPSRPRRRPIALVAVMGLALAAALGARWAYTTRPSHRPVLAVGHVRDLAAPDSVASGRVLREMFSTDLGRISDLQVIANSRMLELTPRDADTSRSAFTDAARRAGATELLEGELIPLDPQHLRLEIRRVDVESGLVRGSYRVNGNDRVALLDSMTALLAADLRLTAPSNSLAEISTRSPVAYRLYEEGLRALYQFHNVHEANRLLREAMGEDSTFVMAAYYAWRVARMTGQPDERQLAERVLALAIRASPRDRLLIVTHVGAERSDLRALAAAETLATNYPRDPEALVRSAEVVPDLGRAIALLDRAIALDSSAGSSRGDVAICRLCDAFGVLTSRYEWADSAAAVRRTIRRWRTLRPNDPRPLEVLGDWLVGFGNRAEIDEVRRQHDALGGAVTNVHFTSLVTNLRLDDLDAVERACKEGFAVDDGATPAQYRWHCVIALRMQGRYRDARALAKGERSPWLRAGPPLPADPYEIASVDLEGEGPRAAADEFRRILSAGDSAAMPDGLQTRQRAWLLTLTATAAVAGGDTVQARALVDSIERFGLQSGFRRDPKLHHFVRGLLEATAHRDAAAVREYSAAMDSPTFGFTRINYELGRSLLALHRPSEAIPVVQAALHGGIEGSNLYVTRTALHELLAQLFDANRQRDSAAAHYAVVERAWRHSDPFLRPRYEAARQWLARAGGGSVR